MIEAWNKVDLLSAPDRNDALLTEAERREDVVPISALTGSGLEELQKHMSDLLHRGAQLHEVSLPAGDGSKIAWLHARGDVVDQKTRDSRVHLKVRLSPENWARFKALQSS
jgi:GTPase